MPAKKASAKKTPVRRATPAKKTPAKKTPAKKRGSSLMAAAVSKAAKYKNEMETIWEDDLTYQYPAFKKNNFLSLIVLGLGALLVVIGVYIQVHKESPRNTDSLNQTGVATTSTGTTISTGSAPTTGSLPTTGTFPVDAQRVVEDFYNYFNQDQFNDIPPLYDKNFSTVPGLKTYFTPTRLQSWKKNIIGDLQIDEVNAVIDHPFVQKNPNAMVVQYKTHYTLAQDGKPYEETWYAYIMKYGTAIKLNGFECQQNCAASPFFRLR